MRRLPPAATFGPVLFVVVGLGGCASSAGAPAVAPSATAEPTRGAVVRPTATATASPRQPISSPTATPRLAGPHAARIATALLAVDQLKSYRVVGILTTPDGGRTEFLLEVVAPDRRHLVIGAIEVISIGSTSYVKQQTDWLEVPGAQAARPPVPIDGRELSSRFATAPFEEGGQATVAGEPCDVFTYREAGRQGAIWVGQRDGLIRRLEAREASGSFVLHFVDFDQPMEIRPPA